jgi:hypothetical protein
MTKYSRKMQAEVNWIPLVSVSIFIIANSLLLGKIILQMLKYWKIIITLLQVITS